MKYFGIATLISLFALAGSAQTSTITYQGRLTDGGSPASGTYQMTFALFDAASAGTQQGSTITNSSVTVTSGFFSVTLDFTSGPFAAGASRWLEIAVKKPADPGFITLTPRQQVTSSPYALRTLNAGAADSLSASCVQCVGDANISGVAGSKVSGTVASATNATSATTAATTTGNAGTATKLQTARTINGVAFDGSANITIAGSSGNGASPAALPMILSGHTGTA
ncbi:MAG: hypothetical protein JO314_08045, partial [Acidobacteria bacterium]|nr:hypothetical protein [Acidobacteriota bacterium]